MVSFQCENCGDVFTKKKLDPHYNRCWGQFTCLDCMTTFAGQSYRSHTSCITEDQKYQGALYKEKPAKGKKVNIIEPHEQRRQAYVEDAPEDVERHDNSAAIAIVNAPPAAPSPPPSATLSKPNVFDFLVNEDTPNSSKANLAGPEPMQMIAHAPAIFRSHSNSPSSSQDGHRDQKMIGYDETLTSDGFAYGHGPVPSHKERDLYRTPAPKESRRRHDSPSRYAPEVVTSTVRKSTDKKRKRQVDDLDLSQAAQYANGQMDVDQDPNLAAPVLAHSGLTGGLSRMLSKTGRDPFPPSPAYSNGQGSGDSDVEETPLNATKQRRDRDRKRDRDHEGDAKSDARRGRPSATSTIGNHAGQLVKVRKSRRTSDESRPRKHHRSHKHRSDEHPDRERVRRSSGDSGERRRKPKAIEYNVHKGDDSDDEYEDVDDDRHANGTNGQMVVYGEQSRAELFLSFITKGPDSEKGYSMNKALKRYHRERIGADRLKRDEREQDKMEEEKELWKCLRLRRNEQGEFVLFALQGTDED